VRRHLDAGRTSDAGTGRGLPFEEGLSCPLEAARSFAAGQLDDERVLRLALGLSLFDYRGVRFVSRGGARVAPPQPAYELLALAWAGTSEWPLAPRSGWAARLASGTMPAVVEDAVLRLRMAEHVPLPSAGDLGAAAPSGQRLAASLLLRLGDADRRRLADALTRPIETEREGVTT